jgi:hypothetical protein
MPNSAEFRSRLESISRAATAEGQKCLDVNAGELHRAVGGYPGKNHRMPVCCSVMKQEIGPKDTILREPPSGHGASLTVRYMLPR